MTQKEFEERIGREATGEEFDHANDLYIFTGGLDKDRFCKDYRKHKDSEIIAYVFEEADKLQDRVFRLTSEREQTVDFIIRQAELYHSAEMRNRAILMVGEREYIRRKINAGFDLSKEDRKILDKFLQE